MATHLWCGCEQIYARSGTDSSLSRAVFPFGTVQSPDEGVPEPVYGPESLSSVAGWAYSKQIIQRDYLDRVQFARRSRIQTRSCDQCGGVRRSNGWNRTTDCER